MGTWKNNAWFMVSIYTRGAVMDFGKTEKGSCE